MLLIEKLLGKPIVEEVSREKLPDGVLCRVSYPICNIGERNANNRVYEDAVWDKVMAEKDLQEKMDNRALFGHAEHPEQTQSNLEKTSHVIFEMWKADGKVWQKFDVLDTPTGRVVDCLLRANCQVGVSTRAEGDLEEAEDDEGTYQKVIADSYNFVTSDFTADPSTFDVVPHDVKRNIVSEVKKLFENKDADESEKEFGTCMLESMKCNGESKCQNCGCCKALKESKQYIMEGVWALPNTTARAKKLAELMKNPLSSAEATKKLSSLLGDDELWDKFKYKGDEPRTDDDVRPKVKKKIKQYLKDYEADPEDFKGRKLNDEAKEILQKLVSESKTVETLIKEGAIEVGTEIKYGDKDAKVEKIEEFRVGITIGDTELTHVNLEGDLRADVSTDGVVSVSPLIKPPIVSTAEPVDPEAPPAVEPGTADAVIIGDEEVDEIPEAKAKQRGDCVFSAESSKVTDDKDHFPINDADQARNALARANQYDAAPKWYKGDLDSLVKKVASAVKKKFPSIEVTKAAEKPGKESMEVGSTVKLTKQALETLHKQSEGKADWLVEDVKFDENEIVEGKITKIEERAIEVMLDDGTIVSIEEPVAVSIMMGPEVTDELAPEVEVEMPSEEEVEDMEAAGPLPIEKDVPESKVEEGVDDKLAAGNLLRDKEGKDWTVKEAGDGGLTVTQPGEPGTEKRIEWANVASYGFTKVSEVKVNEVIFKTEEDVAKFVEKNARVTGTYDTRVSVKYSDKLYQSEDTHGLVVQICKDKKIACESKVEEAESVEKDGKWFVESPSGAILGGPYDSKIKADKRKKDVEFYAASKESKEVSEKHSKEVTSKYDELIPNFDRDSSLEELEAVVELIDNKLFPKANDEGKSYLSDLLELADYYYKLAERDVELEDADESKVEEDFEEFEGKGIEIGDTVQIMDLEGNTTPVPKATVYAIDEALGDDGDMHLTIEITGSENKDEQEWYREDQYQIILLKKVGESKVEEGFKTDLKNKDKAAISKKIADITDKLLAGETLSRAEKHYWSDYGAAVKATEANESKVDETAKSEVIELLKQGKVVYGVTKDKTDEGFVVGKISDLKEYESTGYWHPLGAYPTEEEALAEAERLTGQEENGVCIGVVESKKSISTTAKEITNLRVQEASTRAERDKAIELLEEIADEKTQLKENVRKEKAFEAKILINKIGKTMETKELEVDALRAKLEEKAKLAANLEEDSCVLQEEIEKKDTLAAEVKEQLEEIKTNLSNDIKNLNESVSAAEDKHQREMDKLIESTKKQIEEKIKEAKEETEKEVREEVTKEFVKSFVEFKLSETDLKVDENSQALLENCKSLDEVDYLLDEIVDASRRSALHSNTLTSIHVTKREIVDPEQKEAERRVGDAFEGFGFIPKKKKKK